MSGLSIDEFLDRLEVCLPRFLRALMRHERSDVATGVLTLPQFWVLVALREKGPMTVGELSKWVGCGLSTGSEVVARLVRLGMVRRSRSRNDRRRVLVSLSARGREGVSHAFTEKRTRARNLFRSMPERDRQAFVDVMEKIVSSIQERE